MSQTIGQKVKALRKSRNVSQKILCAKLNMPVSTFSNKESHSKFTTNELQIICDTLKCPYELIISDAPFNPMRINYERNDILSVNEPPLDLSKYDETDPIFLTDKEKKFLKRMRTLSPEKRKQIMEYLDKIADGEK